MQLLDMLALQSFTELSILKSEINPDNFRLISDLLFYKIICKMAANAGL